MLEQMKSKVIRSMREIANQFVLIRFSRHGKLIPHFKMNAQDYKGDLEGLFIAGYLNACEHILLEHKAEPFESVDLFVGEVEARRKVVFDFFVKNYCKTGVPLVDLKF